MRIAKIIRVEENERGTYGVLIIDRVPIAVTLEPVWKCNKKDISRIPCGAYTCNRVDSPNFGKTFEVVDVPNRDNILFHWGNKVEDTKGCILLGEEFGYLEGHPAILSSKRAFNEFMWTLHGEDKFALLVRDDSLTPMIDMP